LGGRTTEFEAFVAAMIFEDRHKLGSHVDLDTAHLEGRVAEKLVEQVRGGRWRKLRSRRDRASIWRPVVGVKCLIALPGRVLTRSRRSSGYRFGIANAETAVVGDRLSKLCRNMRSNIGKEISRIGLTCRAWQALLRKTYLSSHPRLSACACAVAKGLNRLVPLAQTEETRRTLALVIAKARMTYDDQRQNIGRHDLDARRSRRKPELLIARLPCVMAPGRDKGPGSGERRSVGGPLRPQQPGNPARHRMRMSVTFPARARKASRCQTRRGVPHSKTIPRG
jgi:hypothetical protein